MSKPKRRKIKRYGWIPDLPDRRDRVYAAPAEQLRALPPRVDLTPRCPAVYDQGALGSCTANAIAGALQFEEPFTPSRLFIYYNERVIEGTVEEDAGATLRDGIKSVATQGAPHERLWPYVIAHFRRRPAPICYADGRKHKAVLYQRIPRTLEMMQGCLASGFPFAFGFAVYESFESTAVANSGVVPMPSPGEAQLGGHAVLAVGYDMHERRFIVRNSWGAGWGQAGYFTMPFDYLLDDSLSDDFWTVKAVA
jgi:C1A family cysteine protease